MMTRLTAHTGRARYPRIRLKQAQRLLLRVDRNARLSRPELLLDRPVQVFKLSIAVWMVAAFQRFLIGLQAVAHRVEQLGHHAMTGLVALRRELCGELAHTLECPPQ